MNVFGFSLQLSSKTFLILRIIERDIIKNVFWSVCKVPVILVRFNWNLIFLYRFSISTQIYNFIKILPVGTEFLEVRRTERWTDRRTDTTKLIVNFRNFANALNTLTEVFIPRFAYTWCVQVLRSPKEAFAAAMQSWRERCEKCVCLQGDYIEKWLHFQLPVVSSFF